MSSFQDSYIRIVASGIRIVCGVVVSVAIVMVVATTLDCLLKLGWGWDCNHIWISFFIITASLLIYLFASKMEQLLTKD